MIHASLIVTFFLGQVKFAMNQAMNNPMIFRIWEVFLLQGICQMSRVQDFPLAMIQVDMKMVIISDNIFNFIGDMSEFIIFYIWAK